jgi:hypothetical protein
LLSLEAALFASAVWIFVIAGRVLKRFKKSQKSLSKTDKLLLRVRVVLLCQFDCQIPSFLSLSLSLSDTHIDLGKY